MHGPARPSLWYASAARQRESCTFLELRPASALRFGHRPLLSLTVFSVQFSVCCARSESVRALDYFEICEQWDALNRQPEGK